MSILPAQHPAGKPPRVALTAGSLCTGYGGLDLAVTAVTGARLAWVAETDQYAAAVLAHHWPGVPNLGDVTALDWAKVPPVDLVSAGWPCQDISYAGPGAGITEGTRSGIFSRGAKRTCEAFLCFSWSLPWRMFAASATGVVERLTRLLISSVEASADVRRVRVRSRRSRWCRVLTRCPVVEPAAGGVGAKGRIGDGHAVVTGEVLAGPSIDVAAAA